MSAERTTMKTAELANYHANPRRGNLDVIKASLEAHGQYRRIVVNTGRQTGRPNEVLVGNHTLSAARELGWDTMETFLIDVDEQTAARIVLIDNRTSDLGGYDDAALYDLLSDLEDLEGTGYDEDDLEDLVVALEPEETLDDGDAAMDRFAASSVRAMYVTYELDEFVAVQERIAKLMSEMKLPSASAVVAALAQERVEALDA